MRGAVLELEGGRGYWLLMVFLTQSAADEVSAFWRIR